MHKIIINLPNRPNRLIHTKNELRKVNLSDIVTILEAKTPEYSKKYFYKILHKDALINIKNPKNTNIIPNYKAVACIFSHLKCWEYIVENNISDCLIIEDDIKIVHKEEFLMDYNNFLKYIKKPSVCNKAIFITFNSKNFDCFYEDSKKTITNEYLCRDGFNGIKRLNNPFMGTHFYYVNRKMARYFISSLKKIKYQLDLEIGLLSSIKDNYEKKNRIFGNIICDSIIQSKKFVSDIQNYLINIDEISLLFELDENLCKIIYEYIPDIYKKHRKEEQINIKKNYTNIYEYLDNCRNFYY
jgi:GR25 family glycosyltransferase involved in LPS biosynthesis